MKDHVLGRDLGIRADLLALSAGMTAADTSELSGIMKFNRNPEGYFMEAHVKLRPVDMPGDGIFSAARPTVPSSSPRPSPRPMPPPPGHHLPGPGEIKLSAIAATGGHGAMRAMSDLCALLSVRGAAFDEKEKAVVIDEALCHGCGVCAAVCPRKTIRLNFYEDDQLICKIDALLAEEVLMAEFEPTIIAFCCEF